jgi:hypothetical protein
MKKLLSSVLVAGLLGVVGANAADYKIVIQGTVLPVAAVSFADISSYDLKKGNVFKDSGNGANGNTIDLGNIKPNETFTAVTRDIYVKTNTKGDVRIIISDITNNGKLTHSDGDATINVSYKLGGSDYTLGTPYTISSGSTNDGSDAVLSGSDGFVITPAAASGLQKAGSYSTTLTVVVSAN